MCVCVRACVCLQAGVCVQGACLPVRGMSPLTVAALCITQPPAPGPLCRARKGLAGRERPRYSERSRGPAAHSSPALPALLSNDPAAQAILRTVTFH